MCLTILQISNLLFLLQSKHKVCSFLSLWVPANKLKAVNKSAFCSDE